MERHQIHHLNTFGLSHVWNIDPTTIFQNRLFLFVIEVNTSKPLQIAYSTTSRLKIKKELFWLLQK